MTMKIKKHQMLIIGIISLVATGTILSSNWKHFIKNSKNKNIIHTSYQINSSSSVYDKYESERTNIMFQINILKSAIKRNNIMYQQYNTIFKNNISYVKLQKSSIEEKIGIANSSIIHELNILENMKTILRNHPFNYMTIFENKNYTLTQIVSQKN